MTRRILFVSGRLVPWDRGGSFLATYGLASSISARRDIDVTLLGTVQPHEVRATENLVNGHLKIRPVKTPGKNDGLLDVVVSNLTYPFEVAHQKYDIVHFGILPGVRAGGLANLAHRYNLPLVLSMYDFPPFEARSYSKTKMGMLATFAHWTLSLLNIHLFDAIIVNCNFIGKAAISAGIDKEKIYVLPLGINNSEFGPQPSEKVQDHYILCFGPFFPKKGQHRLISAYSKTESRHNTRLILVGSDTPYRRMCMQLVKRLGIESNVQFQGAVHRRSLISMIRNATVCVFPSDYEGFGLSILESMSCQKPVIATKFGGPSEYIIDNVNGLLVDPYNENMLAIAIDRICQNDEFREALAFKARETSLQYDWTVVSQRYLDLYDRL